MRVVARRSRRSLGLLLCAAALVLPVGLASAGAYVPTEAVPTVPTEAASDVEVANVQHGAVVRGSIVVASAASRLRINVFTPRSALGGRGAKPVRVGRSVDTVAAGSQAFAIELNDIAERALRGTGRLPVTVKIKVTPPSGTLFKAIRKATLILFGV